MKKLLVFMFMMIAFVVYIAAQAVVDPAPEPVPWYENMDKIWQFLLWVFGSGGLISLIASWIPSGTPLPKWLRVLEYLGKVIVWIVENLLVKDRKKGGGTHNIVKLEEEVIKKEPLKAKTK